MKDCFLSQQKPFGPMLLRTASINLSCNKTAFECCNNTIRKVRVGSGRSREVARERGDTTAAAVSNQKEKKIIKKTFYERSPGLEREKERS